MRVLVTGGTGFVGSALLKELISRGHIVYCLSRQDEFDGNRVRDVSYVRGDLLNYDGLKLAVGDIQPEAVVHLAAYTPVRFSFDNPVKYAQINYVGTVNLVEAVLRFGHGVRQLLAASTAEVYGPYLEPRTVTEESVPTPSTPYAVAKLAADHYVRYVHTKSRTVNYTVLRPTNSYGRQFELPEEARGYFMEKMIIGMLTSKSVEMDGSGLSTRRFMHVSDHVRAYVLALGNERAFNQVFNVAPDTPAQELWQVAKELAELTGYGGDVVWATNPRPMEPNHLDISPKKIVATLGFHAHVSEGNGLARVVEYWKAKLAKARA